MTDLSQLISVLQGIVNEISKVREEIHSARSEFKRLYKSMASGAKEGGSKVTPDPEQSREEWLKEAASRSSKNLFKGT